jgi:cyclohexanone monooxygenase
MILGSQECTPGYYNNEGKPAGPENTFFLGYPEGANAYFEYIEKWRASGDYEGLEFR